MDTSSRIDLSGKVAVATGAGRGIGAAIAGAFAEAAANVSSPILIKKTRSKRPTA